MSGLTAANVKSAIDEISPIGKIIIDFQVSALGLNSSVPPELTHSIIDGTTLQTLNFDATANEYCYLVFRIPKKWKTTINPRIHFLWTHSATTINFDVLFKTQINSSIVEGDGAGTGWKVATTMSDTGGNTDTAYVISAFIDFGLASPGDLCHLTLYRDAVNGSDTLAVDARLHGVWIEIETDAATED